MRFRQKRIFSPLIISAAAGFIAVFIFRRNLAAEASILGYFGFIPQDLIEAAVSASSVKELFSTPLAGFIYFDFFDIINVLLVAILFVPVLYLCGKRIKWVGVAGSVLISCCLFLYIISNPALLLYINRGNTEQLTLILKNSDQYFILSEISVLLLYTFGLFITAALRKFSLFSRFTFIFGLLTNITGLLYFPAGLFIGELRYLAIVLAAPFTVIWHFNIAAGLLKMIPISASSRYPV